MKFEKFNILEHIPHRFPYRFIDSISEVSDNHIVGFCCLNEESFFYQGHFFANPITPGFIITEIMAQIGILGLGLYLNKKNIADVKSAFLTTADVKFYNISYPGDNIRVVSNLIYYKFNNIKCNISAHNQDGILICKGIFSGVVKLYIEEK
ncbi:3-hydroxyacyl-ACP dehydratase [Myroides odoratus]|uniref:3-hydroxyacyl-ACP dehydratase FabZ family protein n=1 Tax=Myroides odoratus TaxID=256 RepID=UPI00333FC1A0